MSGDPESGAAEPGSEDPRIGMELEGRYRIIEPLAAGGMGVVYRGERVHLGRPVAIKFLHADFAANNDSRKRFERELKAMSKMRHPNCVAVTDFGIAGESPYIVMELVSGQTLAEVLHAEGRLPPGRVLFIASQILAALAHAHSQEMVHRDIKPANVILADVEGTLDHVYVLDFGLAKFVSPTGGLRGEDLTASWMVLGTPSYMAPEQARAEGVDHATDIYATGVLLFELLTGEKPYRGSNPIDILHQHQNAPVGSIRERLPEGDFSPELDAVVQKAMAKQREQRFASAKEFAEALDSVPEAVPPTRASSQNIRIPTSMGLGGQGVGASAGEADDGGEVDGTGQTVPLDLDSSSASEVIGEGAAAGVGAGAAEARAESAQPAETPAEARAESAQPAEPAQETALIRKDSRAASAAPSASAAARAASYGKATAQVTPPVRGGGGRTVMVALLILAFGAGLWYVGDEIAGGGDEIASGGDEIASGGDEIASAGDPDTAGAGDESSGLDRAGDDDPGIADGDDSDSAGNGDSDGAGDGDSDGAGDGDPDGAGDGDPDGADGQAQPADQSSGQAEAAATEPAVVVSSPKDITALVKAGKREAAIDGIIKLQQGKYRNSAYLSFVLGNLYFEKQYWNDAVDAYSAALRQDRAYRGNAILNANLIDMLQYDQRRFRGKIYTLYRQQIRAAGRKYLRRAAKNHNIKDVRERADWLLKRI